MNTAVRTVNQSVVTPRWLAKSLLDRSKVLVWALLAAVVLSGLGVVYMTNNTRVLYRDLQQGQSAAQQLDTQWGQLLLEQGALRSESRVEQIAASRLGMSFSNKRKVIVVNGE